MTSTVFRRRRIVWYSSLSSEVRQECWWRGALFFLVFLFFQIFYDQYCNDAPTRKNQCTDNSEGVMLRWRRTNHEQDSTTFRILFSLSNRYKMSLRIVNRSLLVPVFNAFLNSSGCSGRNFSTRCLHALVRVQKLFIFQFYRFFLAFYSTRGSCFH